MREVELLIMAGESKTVPTTVSLRMRTKSRAVAGLLDAGREMRFSKWDKR